MKVQGNTNRCQTRIYSDKKKYRYARYLRQNKMNENQGICINAINTTIYDEEKSGNAPGI
jgi:hypothetical protein